MVDKIDRILFSSYYPNMYVKPLENYLVKRKFESDLIEYRTDILALVNDDLGWANVEALSDTFKESNFKILTDVFDLVNDNQTATVDFLMEEDKLKYSTLEPSWLMDFSINSWKDEADQDYYNSLKESKEYLIKNYIIQSRIIVFPTEVFGRSESAVNTYQKNDYIALKFWQLTHKSKPSLTKEEKKLLVYTDEPLIVFLGLFKLNIAANAYQVSDNMKSIFNPTNKQLKNNYLLKNYSKEDRFYLAVNRYMENKTKIDMSVLREAIQHYVINEKYGVMMVDKTSYGVKKI